MNMISFFLFILFGKNMVQLQEKKHITIEIWLFVYICLIQIFQKARKLVKFYILCLLSRAKAFIHLWSLNDPNAGLQLRLHIQKLFFLFLNQNVCCGYSKEPSH